MKNDEIKEILDYLHDKDNYIEELGVAYKRIYINNGDLKILLDYITNLQQENEKLLSENIAIKSIRNMVDETIYKSRIEKATKDLFELKDMIYKPETRDENIPIQQKISSIIKQLNGKE